MTSFPEVEHIKRLGGDVRLGAVVEEAQRESKMLSWAFKFNETLQISALDPLRKRARRLSCAQTALWIT